MSDAPESDSCAVSFIPLESRTECKEDYRMQGTGYLTRLCAPLRVVMPSGVWKRGGLLVFQRCGKLDAQEQETGLA